jgi:hypothetical protein
VAIANGDFETGLAGWDVLSLGCDNQAWFGLSGAGSAHTGSGCARATSRYRTIGPQTWCGILRQVLETELRPGIEGFEIAGFWRSQQVAGTAGGEVGCYFDDQLIGTVALVQGPWAPFNFPFTPIGYSGTLEFRCLPPQVAANHWRDYFFDDLVLGTPSMSAKLTQIRNALIARTQAVPGIGDTGSNEKAWWEANKFPAAYVKLLFETKAIAPMRMKEGRARFVIPTVLLDEGQDEAFENLYQALETQIEADPTLGGLTMECFVSGVGQFETTTKISQNFYTRDIFVEAVYRHTRGAP